MDDKYKLPEERIGPDIPGSLKEDDTRVKLIDPQLRTSGWTEENIRRAFYVKVGRVIIEGNTAKRDKRKYIDYVLFYNQSFPIAVIEAKRAFKNPADGISQAKEYAQLLGVYFAYSTNGEVFEEFDFSTDKQTTLEKFPTPEELYERWKKITSQKSLDLTRIENNPLLQPLYYDPQKTPPLLSTCCNK